MQEDNANLRFRQLDDIIENANSLIAAFENKSMTKSDINRKAALLLQECHLFDFSPPLSLFILIAKCLGQPANPLIAKYRGTRIDPKNYHAWDAACRFEAKESPDEGAPLSADLSAVAWAAFDEHGKPLPGGGGGAADFRANIRDWRQRPEYIRDVEINRWLLKNWPDHDT